MPPGFNASTHLGNYLSDVVEWTVGVPTFEFTITGNWARTGGGSIASSGAMTGDDIATGVGSAAIYDTFLGAAVVGNFRCAPRKTMDKDKAGPFTQ